MRLHIALHHEASVEEAVRTASHMAQQMGFDTLNQNLIATAVSEIATNVIKYAEQGAVHMQPTRNGHGIKVVIEDQGPGIPNLKAATVDGFSTTKTSLGIGLGVAKRAMDTLRVYSKPQSGTRVVMRKFLALPKEQYDCGAVSVPDDQFVVNGDAYLIKAVEGNKLLLAVIDGLGQGPKAAQAATVVKQILEAYPRSPLDVLIGRCDKALRALPQETGVALGLLRVTPRTIQYAGVGDTFVHLWGASIAHPLNQNGIVGLFRLPTIRVHKQTFSAVNAVIVMCTDGVHNHFTSADLPLEASAWGIADYIMRHNRRAYGDATVLVAKINRP